VYSFKFSHKIEETLFTRIIHKKEFMGKYHRKYNPVPPTTMGTWPLSRILLVACLASSKNCPTEYSEIILQ
jgi:hypothetical protein